MEVLVTISIPAVQYDSVFKVNTLIKDTSLTIMEPASEYIKYAYKCISVTINCHELDMFRYYCSSDILASCMVLEARRTVTKAN